MLMAADESWPDGTRRERFVDPRDLNLCDQSADTQDLQDFARVKHARVHVDEVHPYPGCTGAS